ncbi:MAG: FecR domain-containing protein, partial [Deltaproteobacteria bacterium]|nr:FecR domain-containing protein [Deltaproteobacteria bacterium]
MKAALASALLLGAWLATGGARAEGSTPGYPERVLQWTVQKGETCADIAKAMYGKSAHERLLARYNAIKCRSGKTLAEGTTLVVPEKVSEPPTAQLQTVNPAVRTRSPGGAWTPAGPGMSLGDRYSVNTLEKAAADIHFVDRTRVYLGEHTLVVIYDTASRSRIAKVNPADVKLDQGELQAGLAALRGGTVDIEVEGGGLVSAQSRNTVVKRRGKTTTVAVFDGSAKVASGGQEIAVPVDHGTSFTDEKPPAPPRPLPPAPAWETGTARGFALAPEAGGLIQAAWSAVPQAVAYRF